MEQSYSFSDIFTKGIETSCAKTERISSVVIPKIQRPYAQGRSDSRSSFVRHTFLEQIFKSLEEDKELDLNFIYGDLKRTDGGACRFEVLDGQQRLTTLFLLYWYIADVELQSDDKRDKDIRERLSRFSYETRASSTVFCKYLSTYRVSILPSTENPSTIIRKAKWYFSSFDRDSTITGMLTMLDAIHERYGRTSRLLFDRLSKLRFMIRSLGEYSLSEELYIKMNARGLQLTPFENFKADLIDWVTPPTTHKEYKKEVEYQGETMPFYLSFGIKLDSKWVDLFWSGGEKKTEFDTAYLKFIARFLAYKHIVYSANDVTDKEMREDSIVKQLYTELNKETKSYENLSFEPAKTLLESHPETILCLEKVLDTLLKNEAVISKELVPIWDRKNGIEKEEFYKSPGNMFQIQFVVFSAMSEYLEIMPNFDPRSFKQWMRVVWNIVENTNIDSLTPTAALIRKFDKLLRATFESSAQNLYETLSQDTDDAAAFKDEREKAKRICEDSTWEDVWKKYEQHPFFKGFVTFFYTPEMAISEYERHAEIASLLFDESGITQYFRKKHLLLRGIISCLKDWNKHLANKYLTENAETHKYLKILLHGNDTVAEMFRSLTSADDINAAVNWLKKHLKDPKTAEIAEEDFPGNLYRYQTAWDKLLGNQSIYDWMAKEEGEKKGKYFRIYAFREHIALAIPNKHYARMLLDTDRAKISQKLCDTKEFLWGDSNQEKTYKKYGDTFGNEIELRREESNRTFAIFFKTSHEIEILITLQDEQSAANFEENALKEALDFSKKEESKVSLVLKRPVEESNRIRITGLKHESYNETYPTLSKFLDVLLNIQ